MSSKERRRGTLRTAIAREVTDKVERMRLSFPRVSGARGIPVLHCFVVVTAVE
jgi:hypothetical protein